MKIVKKIKILIQKFFHFRFDFDVLQGDLPMCTLVMDVKDSSKSGWFKDTPVIGQVGAYFR